MNGQNVVEQDHRQVEEGCVCPVHAEIQAAAQQDYTAQQEHEELRDNGDGETEHWQNDQGNCELREHGGEVGNRQRLPEEDAAIAALPVESVERVENPDDKSCPHDQSGC